MKGSRWRSHRGDYACSRRLIMARASLLRSTPRPVAGAMCVMNFRNAIRPAPLSGACGKWRRVACNDPPLRTNHSRSRRREGRPFFKRKKRSRPGRPWRKEPHAHFFSRDPVAVLFPYVAANAQENPSPLSAAIVILRFSSYVKWAGQPDRRLRRGRAAHLSNPSQSAMRFVCNPPILPLLGGWAFA